MLIPSRSAQCPPSGVLPASLTNSRLQEPSHRQFTVLGKMNWEWTVWTLLRFSFDCIEEHKARNAWEECYKALLKCVSLCKAFKGLRCLLNCDGLLLVITGNAVYINI